MVYICYEAHNPAKCIDHLAGNVRTNDDSLTKLVIIIVEHHVIGVLLCSMQCNPQVCIASSSEAQIGIQEYPLLWLFPANEFDQNQEPRIVERLILVLRSYTIFIELI